MHTQVILLPGNTNQYSHDFWIQQFFAAITAVTDKPLDHWLECSLKWKLHLTSQIFRLPCMATNHIIPDLKTLLIKSRSLILDYHRYPVSYNVNIKLIFSTLSTVLRRNTLLASVSCCTYYLTADIQRMKLTICCVIDHEKYITKLRIFSTVFVRVKDSGQNVPFVFCCGRNAHDQV